MSESHVSPTALSEGGPVLPEAPGGASARSEAAARPSVWTGGRITALVIGALLSLASVGLLCSGAVALWADRTQRDAASYVTTGVHGFSTFGSALATEPIELGSPGVSWLYSQVILGEVRIRVTPTGSGADLFVGIGPTTDVDRYLAGVGHTRISDFWSGSAQAMSGGAPGSTPGVQDFWVASTTGPEARTLLWDPANGSWTVVVMNADGSPGIDVRTDLGATMPSLAWIAIVSLVAGGIFMVGGTLLILGAIRRRRRADLARVV